MTKYCTVCSKPWEFDPGPFFFTRKTSPDGRQEEMFLCQNCQPNVDAGNALFTRAYPPTHERRQPVFWRDPKLLQPEQALNPSQMPLSDYPLIEDFEVVVLCWIHPTQSGKEAWHASARLISPSRGYLTSSLPADLRSPDFLFPQGNFDHPYYFNVGALHDTLYTCVAAQDEFVYILTDNEKFLLDEHGKRIHLYHAWFKVEEHLYDTHWKQAIDIACSLFNAYL